MSIIVNLDVMMAKRKMSLNELSILIDITPANLSILKTGIQNTDNNYTRFICISKKCV